MTLLATFLLTAFTAVATAHYVFPSLIVNGVATPEWQNVRMTNNHYSRNPVTDVSSIDLRCYTSEHLANASTINVAAGTQLGIQSNGPMYHAGVRRAEGAMSPVIKVSTSTNVISQVANIYMAKAPSDVSTWDGSGSVWFKVFQITATTDGGKTIGFPATNLVSVNFTIPKSIPSGQYLVRMEAIALHDAAYVGGAQFYIGCGQINVTGGGSGKPGPLVAIPGVYTGSEPGILIDIYYPIPASYVQPGPAVWSG